MQTKEKQAVITEKVLKYKTNKEKYEYNELFTILAPHVEKRALYFIKNIDKGNLLVDEQEYISVALFEGLHNAIESYCIEKNDNFMPYLYICVDNALKSQVGKDNTFKRKVNEQAITYTELMSRLGGSDLSILDRLDIFVSEDRNIKNIVDKSEELELIKRFRQAKGDLKADIIKCYTLEEDLQRENICKIFGENKYDSKIRARACRIRKEFREFLSECNTQLTY